MLIYIIVLYHSGRFDSARSLSLIHGKNDEKKISNGKSPSSPLNSKGIDVNENHVWTKFKKPEEEDLRRSFLDPSGGPLRSKQSSSSNSLPSIPTSAENGSNSLLMSPAQLPKNAPNITQHTHAKRMEFDPHAESIPFNATPIASNIPTFVPAEHVPEKRRGERREGKMDIAAESRGTRIRYTKFFDIIIFLIFL